MYAEVFLASDSDMHFCCHNDVVLMFAVGLLIPVRFFSHFVSRLYLFQSDCNQFSPLRTLHSSVRSDYIRSV